VHLRLIATGIDTYRMTPHEARYSLDSCTHCTSWVAGFLIVTECQPCVSLVCRVALQRGAGPQPSHHGHSARAANSGGDCRRPTSAHLQYGLSV